MPEKKQKDGREKEQGTMTVEEAGRLGGHKGGQRVKELIEEGKHSEGGEKAERGAGRER